MNVYCEHEVLSELCKAENVYRNASLKISNEIDEAFSPKMYRTDQDVDSSCSLLQTSIFEQMESLHSMRMDRNSFTFRSMFTDYFSWAIPTRQAITAIKNFVGIEPILEIGSGLGLWSLLLFLSGCIIMPQDNCEMKCHKKYVNPSNVPYEKHLRKDIFNVLFLCWPDYESSFAVDALRQFTGNKLVYIGEQSGGCCADDEFFEEISKNWTRVPIDFSIPSWRGVYDDLYFYERKVPIENRFTKIREFISLINEITSDDFNYFYGNYRDKITQVFSGTFHKSTITYWGDFSPKYSAGQYYNLLNHFMAFFEKDKYLLKDIDMIRKQRGIEQLKNDEPENEQREVEQITNDVEQLSLPEESWTLVSNKKNTSVKSKNSSKRMSGKKSTKM